MPGTAWPSILGELGPRRFLSLASSWRAGRGWCRSPAAPTGTPARHAQAWGPVQAGAATAFLRSSPASVTSLPPRDEGFTAVAGAGAGAGAAEK